MNKGGSVMEASDITDEMLTAFLDGEADPETSMIIESLLTKDPALAARLEALTIPLSSVQKAFDHAMEAAPAERLDALLEGRPLDRAAWDQSSWLKRTMPVALAASILALVIGLAAGRLILPPDSGDDWRVAVAEYQALYSKDTLGAIDPDPVDAETMIQSVAAKVGAPIRPETLASLDRLTFKRAQILRWESAPLAQFAFLSEDGEPFALCATPVQDGDQPIVDNELKDLATSSWVQGGVAYMVIGGSDSAFAASVAEQVRARL